MLQLFPHKKHRFEVFFLFPKLAFGTSFQSVGGLNTGYSPETVAEGGVSGFSHQLTNRGSFGPLSLTQGLTPDRRLYEWCSQTFSTMNAEPCNILISLLDSRSMPVKNWLVFHAIPTNWSVGDLSAEGQTGIVVESVSCTYQSFMMI